MILVLLGPPLPSLTTRVNDRAALVTKNTILFKFNCSWFSDVNGAVKFFTVVVTESEGKGTEVRTNIVQVIVQVSMSVDGWVDDVYSPSRGLSTAIDLSLLLNLLICVFSPSRR